MKIPVEGGNPTELTDYFSQHAQWSPDGHYIVFDGDFGTRIYLASAHGGPPVRIVPDDILVEMSGMPCWSHDGKMIAFHSFGVLYTLKLKSAEFKKIFHLEGKKILPYSWTKDSKIIYASALDTATREYDIWKIPLIGEPEQITFLEKRQTKPSLSPDDSLMVITSTHGGNPDLWIMPTNGGNMVQITFFEGDERNRGFDVEASWSPDGKYIAFSSTRTDYWAIWLMEPDMKYIKNKLKNN
jgi:Tol biopolymer transport system component